MSLEMLLPDGAEELGTTLDESAVRRFRAYYDLLVRRNSEFNLTAITGEDAAARLHFLDCLGLLGAYDFTGKRVIDVGSGAGFPGLPLKIALPSVDITLVDSTEKKVNFLSEAAELMGLEARCVHGRAEELGQSPDFRESFDTAVSRAVARLNVLCELCLPLVKVGGAFVAMKSADSDGELREAHTAIVTLGGDKPEIFPYTIPGTDIVRRAVVIRKASNTPKKYPRRFGAIKKSPL